jgi:hypothetical protein
MNDDNGFKGENGWSDVVSIKKLRKLIMEWTVEGSDSDPLYSKVETSAQWFKFLQWRNALPKDDWKEVIIEHKLCTHKNINN